MVQRQPAPEQQQAVLATYQQQATALRDQLADYVTALWVALGLYRAAQMRDFTAQVVPIVQAAMGHMQALTSAYLSTLEGLAGGSQTPAAVPSLGISDVRNGADPAEVYGRPFHLVWRQLDRLPREAGSIDKAIRSGLDRAVQLAKTDVQLAKTHTSQAALKPARNITGYRRQLEGAYSCALCIVASTRRYHKSELLPMHPACDCAVLPIYGIQGHGPVLDEALLAQLHATINEQFGADSTTAERIWGALNGNGDPLLYRDVLVVHDHSELGPVLGVRGQKFTSPDIAA
jgi:hypothetical protein